MNKIIQQYFVFTSIVFIFIFVLPRQEAKVPNSLVTNFSKLVSKLRRPTPQPGNTNKIPISGTYRLTYRDEHFGDFLESIGMSRSYLSFLENMEETLTVLEGTNTNPNWTMILKTSKLYAIDH